MLNASLSKLTQFFTKDKVIVFILVAVLIYALYVYSGSKYLVFDSMQNASPVVAAPSNSETEVQVAPVAPTPPAVSSLKPVTNPADLLPKDTNSAWGSFSPAQSVSSMLMPDLLQAGYHAGLNTIGQSLKNPNLQLRSDPVIPRVPTGPWNQSTIEDPPIRREFEIGN